MKDILRLETTFGRCNQRVLVVRRFLIETGYLAGEAVRCRRVRHPIGKGAPPLGRAAACELEAWGCWQREARGIKMACESPIARVARDRS